jgi:hypothetical protein
MSLADLLAFLNCSADVRETTRSDEIFESSVVSASVGPAAKNSCAGSCDRSSSGSTARDSIRTSAGVVKMRRKTPGYIAPARISSKPTSAAAYLTPDR